ncbi:MAG TPA: phosphoribosylformylglycinamidine synthase, purS protein [Rhodospirillales bacterium]|nr:phosphoribosylformylglycinamidine synthase, purS protein [Rhodospirillales bacterium]
MKARVAIRYRPGVLDPEARAIEKALANLGFTGVRGVARTRIIELELEAADREAAEAEVRRMSEELLANPVIETYSVTIADR